MSAENVEYYSSDDFSLGPKLWADSMGLRFRDGSQIVELAWSDVRALVPAAVQPGPEHDGNAIAALGIVLRRPFFEHPVLVDGVLPNLDYAVRIESLSEHAWARALTSTAVEVVERIAGYARPAGVEIIAPTPAN